MTTPAHYPHSYTFLATHMARLSRGVVIIGLTAIAWIFIVAIVFGVWQLVAGWLS